MHSEGRDYVREKRERHLRWLSISYRIVQNRAPDIVNYDRDLQRAYEAAKQILMEIWTIRAFWSKLGLEADKFDELIPDLKIFRDAIAHIDERSDESMLVKGAVRDTRRARRTLAGGLLTTIDGVRWSGFSYCYGLTGSESGLFTPFA